VRWVERGAVARREADVVVRLTREGGPAPRLADHWPGAEPLDADAVLVPEAPTLHGPAPLVPWTRWRVSGPALGPAFEVETTWQTDAPPPDHAFSTPSGRYERRAQRLAEGWQVTRRYQRRGGRVDAAEWPAFLAFCARVERAEREGPR
jgi:hypothetical protein